EIHYAQTQLTRSGSTPAVSRRSRTARAKLTPRRRVTIGLAPLSRDPAHDSIARPPRPFVHFARRACRAREHRPALLREHTGVPHPAPRSGPACRLRAQAPVGSCRSHARATRSQRTRADPRYARARDRQGRATRRCDSRPVVPPRRGRPFARRTADRVLARIASSGRHQGARPLFDFAERERPAMAGTRADRRAQASVSVLAVAGDSRAKLDPAAGYAASSRHVFGAHTNAARAARRDERG